MTDVPAADGPASKSLVHKLMTGAEWRAMAEAGASPGSAHDARDGYLHFSTTAQVRESAAKHRAGEPDLWLVTAEAAALGKALRWEGASGGTRAGLFPHLYGPFPVAAVRGAAWLPSGPDGRHRFPGWVP